MMTAPLITAGLNAIVLALTPVERWQSARRFNPGFVTERWFILAAVIVLIALAALLIVVSLNRTVRERKVTGNMFFESADKAGLSKRERQVMLDIAAKAGLRQSSAIFTMNEAFERGAAKMIEERLGSKQTGMAGKDLRTELSFLREKLGFRKQVPTSAGSTRKSRKLSSRQIPVGKKMYITRRKSRESDNIECTVIKNDEMELVARLSVSLESEHGEAWLARYLFGASVWEFDTTVINSYDDILVLSHNNNIRFINRRRFLRVPVSKPAFIANFPFTRTSVEGGLQGENISWGPPQFVNAVITELAGPGLRIEAGLDVKIGDRVLVVFNLDEEKNMELRPDGKMTASKVIEDMGEVRHIKAIKNGLSIAVELMGLSDSDVNELIRATNAASLQASAKSGNASDVANTKEGVAQPSVAQGV